MCCKEHSERAMKSNLSKLKLSSISSYGANVIISHEEVQTIETFLQGKHFEI